MILVDKQKLEIAFKAIRDIGFTSVNREWYEEYLSSINTPMGNNQFWLDSGSIPGVPPGVGTPTVQVVSDLILTPYPQDPKVFCMASLPGDVSTRLENWIPPKYHRGYSLRLFQDNGAGVKGTEILTFDSEVEWFPFYFGIVYIPSGTGAKLLPLHVSGYRYTGRIGVVGTATDAHFEYTQAGPSLQWTIVHNLGKNPSVLVLDSSQEEILPDKVVYLDSNTTRLDFLDPQEGVAYLN